MKNELDNTIRRHRDDLGYLWKHKKRKTVYEILGFCIIEETGEVGIIYKVVKASPMMWVRPVVEFFDGRFEKVINDA